MRNRHVALTLFTFVIGGLFLVGCGDDVQGCDGVSCSSAASAASAGPGSGQSGSGGAADACVPRETSGPVEDGCGVFVSSSLGDDGNAGTKSAPLKTLAAAILHATGAVQRVYACAETFDEVIVRSPIEPAPSAVIYDEWNGPRGFPEWTSHDNPGFYPKVHISYLFTGP